MLEFWYTALHAEIGIVIESTNAHRTMMKLYATRRELNDPDLSRISIVQSPTSPNQLWLVKRNGEPQVSDADNETHPEPV